MADSRSGSKHQARLAFQGQLPQLVTTRPLVPQGHVMPVLLNPKSAAAALEQHSQNASRNGSAVPSRAASALRGRADSKKSGAHSDAFSGSPPETPRSGASFASSGGGAKKPSDSGLPLGLFRMLGGSRGAGGTNNNSGSASLGESNLIALNQAGDFAADDPNKGWRPVGEAVDGPTTLVAGESVVTELSTSMVNQLNNMYTYVHQLVLRERSRHSSSVSLMMRKVDKDLKDTFASVREIFSTLSEQLIALMKEVETSRTQLKTISEKYNAVRKSADEQAVYVLELEAVLNGQGGSQSNEMLRNIAERKQAQAAPQAGEQSNRREQRLDEENRRLRAELRKLERVIKEAEIGANTAVMPEMSASWTRRGSNPQPGAGPEPSDASTAGSKHDIVGAVMDTCDASRAVPRSKLVAAGAPHTARERRRSRDVEETVDSLRRRAEKAEANMARMQKLVSFSSSSLLLLRDVFTELRNGKCIAFDSGEDQTLEPEEAAAVLEKVVRAFQKAIPKLGSLPDVLRALNDEALRSAATPAVPPLTKAPPRRQPGGPRYGGRSHGQSTVQLSAAGSMTSIASISEEWSVDMTPGAMSGVDRAAQLLPR